MLYGMRPAKREDKNMWVWLVLLYGLLKGGREIVKKKSMEKSSVMEVLFFYTLISFIFVLPTIPKVGGVGARDMLLISFKSLIIFTAWLLSFRAIKQMPVSLYGILDLSRVLFSTLLAMILLNDIPGINGFIGLSLVCLGLFLCNRKKNLNNEKVKTKIVIFAFISSFLNAVSGVMDKILTQTVNDTQLQFWYMLFMVLYYIIYILITRTKIDFVKSLKNYWIWILAIMFVIGDKALFIANGIDASRASVMTLIKQSCCIVTIIAGRVVFKEKNIKFKLFCALIIVTGIVIATVPAFI